MRVFITGGSASGKSAYAGRLAEKMAAGRPILYIASMPEEGPDAAEKIRRHEKLRRSGHYRVRTCLDLSDLESLFQELGNADRPPLPGTERGLGQDSGEGSGEGGGVCGCPVILFDSLDGFLADVLFVPPERYGSESPDSEVRGSETATEADHPDDVRSARERVLKRLERDLDLLDEESEHLLVVADGFFSDGTVYDSETEAYIELAGAVCRGEVSRCDAAVEVVCGIPILFKAGPVPEEKAPADFPDTGELPRTGRRALYEYFEIPYYRDVPVHEDTDAVH